MYFKDITKQVIINKQINKIKIGFHTNQLSERGTEIALFDYAYYNEKFYNNKSIIFYKENNKENNIEVINKFKQYFKCYGYTDFEEVNEIIEKNKINYLYSIISGEIGSCKLTNKCPNLLHAVFTVEPHGDKYTTVSKYLSEKFNNTVDYIPHMINLVKKDGNWRDKLFIPNDAVVLGRYGGFLQFNIMYVYEAIRDILNIDENIYFLFANTQKFYEHPRIIYLDKIINTDEKINFINTCDAMIHGRLEGETFGLAVGEFSMLNKPVITNLSLDCIAHIDILGNRCLLYNDYETVMNIFKDIRTQINIRQDWNAYNDYKPETVMKKFMTTYNIPYNNSIKILYIGFWTEHKIQEDHIYLNVLKDGDYIIEKSEVITDEILSKYDIIICGSFINDIKDMLIITKHLDKIIYNITEPIEFNNILMYKIYLKNLINLSVGCIEDGKNTIKYPHYMDYGLTEEKIMEMNEYILTFSHRELLSKKFCCLINRHDLGQTRTGIFNKINLIDKIDCPSSLFNNYPNNVFEKMGRINFQKEYLFSICPENHVTKLNGYVTEKLYMACIAGTIPIYYGKLDDIDKQIFNINRIILFDPTSEESITNAYLKVLKLMANYNDLFEYYKQPIFCDSAIETINKIKYNLKFRLNNFINNKNELINNNNFSKLNGIDHIVWINLDRSLDRKYKMEKQFENIKIPITRISAIDGKIEDYSSFNYLERPMTNYEIAVTLSHIKAYSYLSSVEGNYFFVLEDDVKLDNLKFFKSNLNKIISEAPTFDILLIQKIYTKPLKNLYTKWNPDIYSTAAYIITKEGCNKLINTAAKYEESNNNFAIMSRLSIADYFLYYKLNTWVYKYNFISTLDEESIIHPEHINIHINSSNYQYNTIINDLVLNN
jgi:GR25 family glycosyltransferase involved in LPS biosynthesis